MNAEEKFREIYEEYKNMILKIVYDRTGDYHIAQDICQETFARLYGYQNDINLDMVKGWLIVVASHLTSDYKKKASSRREIPTDVSRDGDDCAPEEEVARHLERAEHRRAGEEQGLVRGPDAGGISGSSEKGRGEEARRLAEHDRLLSPQGKEMDEGQFPEGV